jgi:hypothetical protein
MNTERLASRLVPALLAALLVGCPSDDDTDAPTPTAPPTSDTAVVPTGDTATVPTGDTAPAFVVDCSNLPPIVPGGKVPGARGYHGLAFDDQGSIVGSNGNSLVKVFTPPDVVPFALNVGPGEQMDYLPNGDLAFSTWDDVRRILPNGDEQFIASGFASLYGLIVGPDGFIYTADQQNVERIDPDTGERTVYVSGIESPKVINWSPSYDRFYVGTNSVGNIYEVETDPVTLEVIGTPTVLAVTEDTWHDSLGVDACGNLYVAEFWDRRMYRISPDGQVSVLVDFQNQLYGHGVEWGSGIGVWDPFTIFVPQPYDNNEVGSAWIGVPSRRYTGDFVLIP